VNIYIQSIKDITQEPSLAQEYTIQNLVTLRDNAVGCMRNQFKLFTERLEDIFKQLADSKSDGKEY
jgi:hypothetical protein